MSQNKVFRPDIQGLRALAVLSVMIFHCNREWLPGGYVGVDIFFVISGYLITDILLKYLSQDMPWRTSLSKFLKSRILRILPAYFFLLIVVSFFSAIWLTPVDFAYYQDSLRKASWFQSNAYFAHFSDYFAPNANELPLLHTWSLAIEIQFYLIIPLFILAVPKKHLYWLIPLLLVILTAFAEFLLSSKADQKQIVYFQLTSRIPEFLVGSCIALLKNHSTLKNNPDSPTHFLSLLGVTFIFIAFLFFSEKTPFPGLAALLPTSGAAMIILGNSKSIIAKILSTKFLVWVGTISYSLYLWHWPILAFMRYYTYTEKLTMGWIIMYWVMSFLLASFSYYFVEEFFRRKSFRQRKVAWSLLFASMVASADGNITESVSKKVSADTLPIAYTRYADPNLICHGKIVGNCIQGKKTSETDILLIGDSHAAMLNNFFHFIGEQEGFSVKVITASSCVPIEGFDTGDLQPAAKQACLNQIQAVKQHLDKSKIIFLTGYYDYQLKNPLFLSTVEHFLQKTQENHQKVYILSDIPFFKEFNPQREKHFTHSLKLPPKGKVSLGNYKKANLTIKNIAKKYGNATYIDLTTLPLFKNAPYYQGDLVYYDQHHLNEIGVQHYAKQAASILKNKVTNR